MDFQEMQLYAAERTIDSLCSGERFSGLGGLGRQLVMDVAYSAKENSDFIFKASLPDGFFKDLQELAAKTFTTSILGIGAELQSPADAAKALVDTVWQAYITNAEKVRDLAKLLDMTPKTLEDMVAKASVMIKVDQEAAYKIMLDFYKLEDTKENRNKVLTDMSYFLIEG